MTLTWLDWAIVLVPLILITAIGIKTQRYVHGVADFMAAGRAAGRYLLTNCELMMGLGLITAIATFEAQFQNGFAFAGPWGVLLTPLNLALILTGYLIYRYRSTRVMTMAQFFEVRYSRRFRIFAGILAWVSGTINYAMFPLVSGYFFVYYCGLPETLTFGTIAGQAIAIPTMSIVILLALGAALLLVLAGGQLTILVTDAVQAIFSYIMFAAVALALVFMFSLDDYRFVLNSGEPGKSLMNPWDVDKLADFNVGFWLIGVFGGIYSMLAWQGGHAFNSSAATPHEAKMGRILSCFRGGFQSIAFMLVVIAALAYMKNPQFASGAAEITERLSHISNPAMRTQMTVPVIMSHILPIGIKGCFCAIMLFLMVTTDVSYLHSWGSIFVQDVILPLRKKPFTPEQQIRAIRWSIVSVALFAFIFSITYRPTTYILMFFALTGTIYLGGAGACITGGLYWKRGTTAGAWGAMIAGMIFAIIGFFGETFWKPCVPQFIEWFPNHAAWLTAHADRFPINGQILWGMAMAVSITLYITLSLITCREPFNMDRMLHRGKYAIDANGQPLPPVPKEKFTWRSFIGIDSEMTIGDKRLTYFAFSWNYFWWIVGMTTFVWQGAPFLAQKFPSLQTVIFWQTWPVEWYTNWFFITTYTTGFGLALVTTVWFTWGSLRDLFRLFDRLRSQRANLCDDGRVIGHHNADETLSDLPATDRPSEK